MQQMLGRLALAGIAVLGAACSDAGTGDRSAPTSPSALREHDRSALGSKFVFVSSRDMPTASSFISLELYASNGDGTNPTRLTNNAFSEYFPTWSPNGHEIAFESNELNAPLNIRDLYIMRDDGTERRFLTPGSAATWSHNGQQLAFHAAASLAPGDTDIFVIDADGTGRTNLTNHAGQDTDADWSPNGRKILFTSRRINGKTQNIYVMNADGSDVTRLSFNATGEDAAPDWSPNGQRIAFARRGVPEHQRYEIYTMNADGTDVTRLTFNAVPDATPSWSPDGKQIAWHSGGSGEPQIHIMNADGSDQHQVTMPPGRNQYVNWGNGHLDK